MTSTLLHPIPDTFAPERPPPAARAVGATKTYGKGDSAVHALAGVDVEFAAGEFTAIMGPSGSGKSTLMHALAGLDDLTSGQAFVGDTDLTQLKDKHLTRLRRDRIGFVFQAFNLIPTLDALENITLPADLAGRKVDATWLDLVIDTVGLRARLSHRPSELSGGQQQRVAVARTLASRPDIVFADEPTGNLDSNNSEAVMKLLDELHRDGATICIVTHDPRYARHAERGIHLFDGRVVDAPVEELAV